MGKKIFKPPASESIIAAKHHGHAFYSSKTFNEKGLLVGNKNDELFRSLLYFDISQLPLFLSITKCTLNMFRLNDEFTDLEKTIEVFQILSEWEQEKVCWGNRPLISSLPIATTKITTLPEPMITWDLTVLADEWYTGHSANLGILLKAHEENCDNLMSFVNGKIPNSELWPYLEISCVSERDGGSPHSMDITLSVSTFPNPHFTSPIKTFLFDYTYLVENKGEHTAIVYLEVSPDGVFWITQTEKVQVSPGKIASLVAGVIAKYSRLCYQSLKQGNNTSLTIYIQGVHNS